eukprot:jgi/Phyca11/97918/e_gw1.2.1384.1
MREEDESDVILLSCDAYLKCEVRLCSVHRDVHDAMIQSAWRAAMRTRHYLTASCLDAPCAAAWMVLYKNGLDSNFLNATSLTRCLTGVIGLTTYRHVLHRPAFKHLLRRFARYNYIPPARSRGRPPKLRYHHQARLCKTLASTPTGYLTNLQVVMSVTRMQTMLPAITLKWLSRRMVM